MVLGLGNPGAEYTGSRHNLDADTVSVLADRFGVGLRRSKERALVAEAYEQGQDLIAEARHEYEQEKNGPPAKGAASPPASAASSSRSRRSAAAKSVEG